MDDRQIISLFFQRDEQALTETDRKYHRYCRKIAVQILQDQEDADALLHEGDFQFSGKNHCGSQAHHDDRDDKAHDEHPGPFLFQLQRFDQVYGVGQKKNDSGYSANIRLDRCRIGKAKDGGGNDQRIQKR